jgi:hypothetical protein
MSVELDHHRERQRRLLDMRCEWLMRATHLECALRALVGPQPSSLRRAQIRVEIAAIERCIAEIDAVMGWGP